MTIKDIYNDVIIESNQITAQSFQLEDFNSISNKVFRAFVNDRYKNYNTVQQVADDLRHLKRTFRSYTGTSTAGLSDNDTGCNVIDVSAGNFIVVPNIDNIKSGVSYYFYGTSEYGGGTFTYTTAERQENGTYKLTGISGLGVPFTGARLYSAPITGITSEDSEFGDMYKVESPSSNYLHLIGCYVEYRDSSLDRSKTYTAKKLNEDSKGAIRDNEYLKPKYNRPYYTEISNNKSYVGVDNNTTTNEVSDNNKVTLEVNVGDQTSLATTTSVHMIHVDYIKRPEKVMIFEKDIWETDEDTSQIMEFPDYLLNTFVSNITTLLLEKHGQRSFDSHVQANRIVGDILRTEEISGSDTHQNSINARQAAQTRQ